MKGLLYKETIILRKNAGTLLGTIVIIGILFFARENYLSNAFGILCGILCSMSVVTGIKMDCVSMWDQLVLSTPVSRDNVVYSKYLSFLFMGMLGSLVGCVVTLCMSLFYESLKLETILQYSIMGFASVILSGSVILPCALLLPVEKSELMMVVSYIFSSAMLSGILERLIYITEHFFLCSLLLLGPCVVMYLASCYISILFYRKKEFTS